MVKPESGLQRAKEKVAPGIATYTRQVTLRLFGDLDHLEVHSLTV